MITKSPRLLALGTVLLCSSMALAQPGTSGAASGSSSSPSSSSSSSSSGSETTTTTTTTIQAPGIEPPAGTGIVSDTGATTVVESTETLPATGGAPLLMALTGALTAGGALLGLKKAR